MNVASWFTPAFYWSIIAGSTAILCEYLYRILPGPYWHHLYIWIPAGIVVGYGVHTLVHAPGASLLSAFVVWTSTTIVLRTAVCVFVLHDKVTPGTWVALVLLVAARFAQQVWK